jgi:hypothetical protein
MLRESGVYYLRVKPKGAKQIRESLKTTNFKIARDRMTESRLELGVEAQKGKAGTWGSIVEPRKVCSAGKKLKASSTTRLSSTNSNPWTKFETLA